MLRALIPALLSLALAACAPGQRIAKPEAPQAPPAARLAAPPKAQAKAAPLPPTQTTPEGPLLRLDYEGFTLWLDCKERAAVKFRYNAQRDTGHEPRAEDFKLDPSVPKDCQQTSAAAYGKGYDRGHQVPANHLDASATAIKQSNLMTNILPQVAQMNRGAWLQTEEIVECYRDIDELHVLGGVLWGSNAKNDYFVGSHGVRTPDAFWKLVVRGNGEAIAWIIPNTKSATAAKLDKYLATVAEVEKRTGEALPVAGSARKSKPAASWPLPAGCDLK